MKPGWVIGLFTAFVIMQIIAGVCEMTYLGSEQVGVLQQLMQPEIPDVQIPIIGSVVTFFAVTWNFISTLWTPQVFFWDYPFFQGTWAIVRYALFIPLSIGLIVSLILAAVRGVSSG